MTTAYLNRIATAVPPQSEEVVAALDEATFAEERQQRGDLGRHARAVEGGEGLLAGQVRFLVVARNASTPALVDLELDQVV